LLGYDIDCTGKEKIVYIDRHTDANRTDNDKIRGDVLVQTAKEKGEPLFILSLKIRKAEKCWH
jgi:hypothetical protein